MTDAADRVGQHGELHACRLQHDRHRDPHGHYRRRAAYGERNDYERLSILPAQLEVGTGVDLILLATARRCWDDALVQVMCHGLRHAERTALFATPDFSALLDCSAQGCEAESQWIRYVSSDSETFQRALHPAAALGLAKLGCDPADIKGLTDYAVGSQTLVGAPVINHDSLRQRGFDEAALERLENYLPRVNHIRAAFTPWVLGKAFCQNVLHLSEKSLSDPLFDILGHLGFDQQDIAAANAFCCGHGSFTGSLDLPLAAKNLFATREALSPDAQMRMAAAVQSFVEGDVGLVLSLPASTTVPERADILLTAWQQGLRSVTLYIEGVFPALQSGAKAEVSVAAPAPASPTRKKMLKRKTAPVATPVPASIIRWLPYESALVTARSMATCSGRCS
ncbi:MAG: hypothetical protein HGA90_07820 [Alphaproteobacteria bacterium]|nr:hypothetical protein [Alphaproteobacteria bacterium]